MERDRELGELGRLLEETFKGTGGLAIVTGPVASGKTALLRVLGERTAAAGGTFLGATGCRAERAVPLGLVSHLLYGAGGAADAPDGLQPTLDAILAALHGECRDREPERRARGREFAAELIGGPGGVPAVGDPAEEEAAGLAPAALHRLCRVFFDLAADGPVVIGVDDAHHADLASMLVLLYLARRLRTVPILLVITRSSRPHLRHAHLQTEFLHQPGCTGIRLGPLGPRGVEALLSAHLGPAAGPALAAECHRVSGGSPLLVRAIADDQRTAAAGRPADAPPPDRLVLGGSFARALDRYLLRSERATREVARALAVLGPDLGTAVLADVLGLGAKATADALAALEEVGLLRDGRYRHDGVRRAVLAGLPPERPAALHARAAEVLHHLGAPLERIGRHLVAAERPTAPWAADVLRRTAEEALRLDEVALAVDCLRVSLDLCRGPQERAEVRAALLRTEWRVDPAAAARHLTDLCAAARENRLDCRDLSVLVSRLLWHGRLEEAAEVLDPMARHLAGAGLTPERNQLTVCLMISQAYPELSERLLPAGLRGRPDPVDPERGSGLQVRAAGSLACVLAGQDAGPPERTGRRARSAGEAGPVGHDAVETAETVLEGSRLDDDTLSAIVVALLVLILADQCERAASWCAHLVAEAAGRNAPMWTALLTALQALTHLRRGELPAAERRAREALALVPVESWGAVVGLPLAVGLLATTAALRPAEAAAFRAVPVPDIVFRTPCGLLYLLARGRHHLSGDRVQAALADFLSCGELMEKLGLDAPALVAWRIEAATAYLRLGRVAEARRLLDEQLAATGPEDHRTRGRALVPLAATTADLGERARLLVTALDHLQAGGDRYEQFVAATELGRTYARLGAEAAARTEEDRAHRLARLCGLAEPVAVARGAVTEVVAEAVPGPVADGLPDGSAGGVADGPADDVPGAAPGAVAVPGTGYGVPLAARSAHVAAGPLPGRPAELTPGARTPRASGRRPAATPAVHRVPPPAPPEPLPVEELSRAELRVVTLAARGHTNRQIAHKLFITVSTVEQHLTRAYRKLRVNRRSDLRAHLLPDAAG
ncbi:AAA family ATPase [Kitasatospora sp. NPDC056327]|uniref:helix-turn-helix transcriptional regulator n=1 Tax=Kitasatospora sp. NPDC056327 TaxID=3345785 RepID=UPI0035E2C560